MGIFFITILEQIYHLMKLIFCALAFFFAPFLSVAQELSNVKNYQKALELAKLNKKPILLVIENSTHSFLEKKAKSTLRTEELIKLMKDNFVVYETSTDNPSTQHLILKYKINVTPTFLFLHANEDVFYKEFGYSPVAEKYVIMLEKALEKKDEKSISELESEYYTDLNNIIILRKLIEARKAIGITNNAELIESYVAKLSPEQLNNYETTLFILEAGPYADGNAFKKVFSNKQLVYKAYQSSKGATIANIRTAISNNTLTSAIKAKNVEQAKALATYLKGEGGKYGHINYSSTMLRYYKGVGDTASFLKNAVPFYDTNYMLLSADTINKLENRYRKSEILKTLPSSNPRLIKTIKDSMVVAAKSVGERKIAIVSIPVNSTNVYSNILNSAAWDFYETGTENFNYLLKALTWSTRSIELSNNSSYYDTLAHILYQLKYYEQAITTEQMAIDQALNEGKSIANYQKNLRLMKNKEL